MGKKKQVKDTLVMADVSTGTQWLQQLMEPEFRDQILKDLFNKMKTDGKLVDFFYTHGRNEHGVDWVVLEKTNLADRFVGIQAKARAITKQGDSRSDSALVVKLQCESAYDSNFNWRGNDIRLDSVQLWTSNHITADAVAEFTAPHSRHKIQVMKPEAIFLLIDRFCPNMVSKVPGLAESAYVRKMANPDPLPTKLLGIQLNPKKHFLEPRFSRYSDLSTGRVFDRRAHKMREEPGLFLDKIIQSMSNVLIVGGELSGKSYILKRISCIVSEQGHLAVLVDAVNLRDKMPKNIYHLLSTYLNWYSLSALKNTDTLNRTIYLLVDNIDVLTDEQVDTLFSAAHEKIVVIIAGKKFRQIKDFSTYYIAGVRFEAVSKFIRTLDVDSLKGSAFVDRATHYIQRTFGTSGLPINPFTVSVMLGECRVGQKKLSTPTMGRLIERFVEGQLGSHSDSLRVDFETKNQFLTHLGGSNTSSLSADLFRRKIAKYISLHGHAHDPIALEQDLVESGLLQYSDDGMHIKWTRSVFKDYYWVRNMVRERQHKALSKRLIRGYETCIAAIAGSQMGDAHEVLDDLLAEFVSLEWMGKPKRRTSLPSRTFPEELLPSDADEEILLTKLEEAAGEEGVDEKSKGNESSSKKDIIPTTPDNVNEPMLIQFIKRGIEEKHYLVGNVAALLVNARGLSRSDKEKAAICVLRSNERMVSQMAELLKTSLKNKIPPVIADTLPKLWGLLICDVMIGDAFLTDIFRGLERAQLSSGERLALADLLVVCGGEAPSRYPMQLGRNSEISDVLAIYFRLVFIYYYRFHKEKDKKQLRDAMKSVRALAKGISLPPVT